ncbi:MAG TPA: AI-2E family transporter [Chloroflexota bacterium]|nr:AI-2E family transporter [Chloroflexota bacterium]
MTPADRTPESAPARPRRPERAATPIYTSERVRNLLLLALLGLLLLIFWAAPGALVALGGGAFLAVLLSIPVSRLARVLPRGLAVLAVFLGLAALLVVGVFLVLPPLLAQLGAFVQAVPQYAAQVDPFLRTEVLEPLQARGLLPEGVDAVLQRLYQALVRGLTDLGRGVLDGALGFLSGLATTGFFLLTLVVIAIYLLVDARRLEAGYLRAVPRRYRWDARTLWESLGRSLSRTFLASLASNTIQGLVAFVGLALLGVPYAALLGAVMWLTAFVPLFGSWLGAIPALLVALTVSPVAALLTGVLYLAINVLDGNVLTPRLQGSALSLHPVVVLVATIAAGQLFGLAGVVVTMPILAAVAVLTAFFLARLRVRPRVTPVAIVGDGTDPADA